MLLEEAEYVLMDPDLLGCSISSINFEGLRKNNKQLKLWRSTRRDNSTDDGKLKGRIGITVKNNDEQ